MSGQYGGREKAPGAAAPFNKSCRSRANALIRDDFRLPTAKSLANVAHSRRSPNHGSFHDFADPRGPASPV